MIHLLEYSHYGEALGNAASVMRSNAASTGLDTPVPTCPGWTVRDLLTHTGWVYRWAAGNVRGEKVPRREELEMEARAASDLLDWFDDGLVDILNALGNAPEEVDAPFFLPNAPATRLAWARRQAHESTIHAVDAMAARLGRSPDVTELWFSEALATDGIDEFVTGWLPLLVDAAVTTLGIITDEADAWLVGPTAGESRRVTPEEAAAVPAQFSGSARGLYLGLWNRGDAFTVSDPAALASWRASVQV